MVQVRDFDSASSQLAIQRDTPQGDPPSGANNPLPYYPDVQDLLLLKFLKLRTVASGGIGELGSVFTAQVLANNNALQVFRFTVTQDGGADGTLTNFALEGATGGGAGSAVFARTGLSFDTSTVEWLTIGIHHRVNHATQAGTMRVYLGRPTALGAGSSDVAMLDPVGYDLDGAQVPAAWGIDARMFLCCPSASMNDRVDGRVKDWHLMTGPTGVAVSDAEALACFQAEHRGDDGFQSLPVGSRDFSFLPMNSGLTPASNWQIAEEGREPVSGWDRQTLSGPLGYHHAGCLVVNTPTVVDDTDFGYYAGGVPFSQDVDGALSSDGDLSTQVTPADAFGLDLYGPDWFVPRRIGAGSAIVDLSGTWEGGAPPVDVEYRVGSGGTWFSTIAFSALGSAPSGTWTSHMILFPDSYYSAPNDRRVEVRAVFAGGPTAAQTQDEFSVGVAIVAFGGPNVGGRGDPPYKSWTDLYDPLVGGLRAHELTRDAVGFAHPLGLLQAPHGAAAGGKGHSDGDDQATYGTTAARSVWNYVAGYVLNWYAEPVCIIAVGSDLTPGSLTEIDKRSLVIAPSSAALGTEWNDDPSTGNDPTIGGWRAQLSGVTSWQELIHCAEQVFGLPEGVTNRIPTGYPSKGDPGALEVPGTTDNLKDTFVFALWHGEADANGGQAATPDTYYDGASPSEAGLLSTLQDIDFDFPTTPVILSTVGDGIIEGFENNIRASQKRAWAEQANAYPGPSLYDLETPNGVLVGEAWLDEAAKRWAVSILDYAIGAARFTFEGMVLVDRSELLLTFSHDLVDPIRDPVQPAAQYDGIRIVDGVELVPDADYVASWAGGPYVVATRGPREILENFDTGTEGGPWSSTDPEGTGPLWGAHEGNGTGVLIEPENGSGDLQGRLSVSGGGTLAGGVQTVASTAVDLDIHAEMVYVLDQRVAGGAALRSSGNFNSLNGTWDSGYHVEIDVENSATGYWRIYDASANLLAEFPIQGTIPWIGTHFHTRLRVTGDGVTDPIEIFGRSWLDGDPEPDVWDFQWADPDSLYPAAGNAGVFLHKRAGANVSEAVDFISIVATIPQYWDRPTVSMGWNRYADGKTIPRAGVTPGVGAGGYQFNANAPPEPILDVPVGHTVLQPYGTVEPAGEVKLAVGLSRLSGIVWPNGTVAPSSDASIQATGAIGPGGDVAPIAARKHVEGGTLDPAGTVALLPAFGSTIAISDQPAAMQLWPRLIPVAVAGTWAGIQPDGFEYRIGLLGAWQPIVTPTIGAGVWSFTFSPGPGQFTDGTNGDGVIEIRANYPTQDSGPHALAPFYVGIMLLLAGDSNGGGLNANVRAGYDEIVGAGTRLSPIQTNFSGNPVNTVDHIWVEETYEPADARSTTANLFAWEPATSELGALGAQVQAGDPTDDGTVGSIPKRSLATHIQGYLCEATGIPVGIVNDARSGAPLYPWPGVSWGGWLKPTVGWDTRPNPNTGYEELIQRVEETIGIETGTIDRLGPTPPTDLHGAVEGVIMSCGSNDVNYQSLPESTHRANIDAFVQAIDDDLGCPVFWEDPTQRTQPPSFDRAEMDKFRAALVAARDAAENVELVTMSYDLDLEANGGDGIHYGSFTNRVTADLPAERIAVALLHYIEGAGPTASPRIARLELVDVADVECQFDAPVLMPANNGGISVFEGGASTPLVEGVDYSIAHAGDTLTITRIGGPLWSEPVWVSFGEGATPEGQGLYDGQNPQDALNVPYALRTLAGGFTGAGPMAGQTYLPVEWAYRVPAQSLLPTFVNVGGTIAPAGQFDRLGTFGRAFSGGLGPGAQAGHPVFAVGKPLGGTLTLDGIEVLLKGLGLTVTGSLIINGIVTGDIAGAKLVGGQLLPAGTVTFSGQYGRQLAGQLDPAGAPRVGPGRLVVGVVGFEGVIDIAGATLVFVEGQIDPVGVIVNRQVAIALAGQVAPSGLFGRLGAFGRTVGGIVDPDGRLFKALPGLKLGGVLDPAGYVNLGDIYAPVAVDAKSIAHRAQVHTLPEED